MPSAKSKATISKSDDRAMDRQNGVTNGQVKPGISLANGPVQDKMDVDKPTTNGTSTGKRKASFANGTSYKEETDSDEDDKPLKKRKTNAVAEDSDDEPLVKKTKKLPKTSAAQVGEESGDEPIAKKLQKEKAIIEKRAEMEAKAIRKNEAADAKKKANKVESDDEDDKPIAKRKAPAKKQANGVKKVKKEESDSEDLPIVKKKAAAKKTAVKKEESTPAKKGKAKVKEESPEEEGEEGEEECKCWNVLKADETCSN